MYFGFFIINFVLENVLGLDNLEYFTFDNSDKPGLHDFKILQRLVLPDGSVLRAKYPGRPSRDCLFTDPVVDGKRYLEFPQFNLIQVVHRTFDSFLNFQILGLGVCL